MRMALKALKWVGIVLGGIIGVIVVAVVVLIFIGGSRVNRTYDIQPGSVAIPTDAAAIERGQHLAEAITGCTSCHGDNLGGDSFFDEPGIAIFDASNLTPGRGGIGGTYSDTDWVRAVRHGVDPDGKGLLIMPADVFNNLSGEDLGAIIAYVKSVPPVDNEAPEPEFGLMGRVLIGIGAFGELVPAQLVDHTALLPAAPAAGVTAQYGGYLVSIGHCFTCHGEDLSGGQPGDPESPLVPNITPGGHPGEWSEGEFMNTIRTGVTPDDHELDGEFMPWEKYAKMTDDELGAIWRYLESVPAIETEEHE